MSELVVQVRSIDQIRAHPNAERLEIAEIGGWQTVVAKDTYRAGELVVLFPPDTLLPVHWTDLFGVTKYCQVREGDPQFDGYARIRCAKIRGEPSFGLAVRPPWDYGADWAPGQDVASYYQARKYLPPVRLTAGDAAPDIPGFIEFSEVENLRNSPDAFAAGELVAVSSKLDGCLMYKTRIAMADGTSKHIMDIKPGDVVCGLDEMGKVVPSRVLRTYNNGKAEKWLTVTGKRQGSGCGNHNWVVHCTPNHRFWSPTANTYIAAEDLVPGTAVLLLRNAVGLSPLQEQVLLGKLLGDGHLRDTPTGAAVEWGQKAEHAEYVDWTEQALGDLGSGYRDQRTSGYGTAMVRSRSVFSPHIKATFQDFAIQRVPSWVSDKLTPIALAFWYMDDGSLSHNDGQEDRAVISTGDYSAADCAILVNGLGRLGIRGTCFFSNGYSAIRLDTAGSELLFLLTAPYVPPVMQYKLPERYRGHAGWLPTTENVYRPLLVLQVVDQVFENSTRSVVGSTRWDIETETHNFFANGILVHNSNCRTAIVNGEELAGSRRLRRKRPDDLAHSTYWLPWTLPPVRELLTTLAKTSPVVILFGEVHGPGIQGNPCQVMNSRLKP